MNNDPELLVGMSDDELEALADGKLAPSAQARLDELLVRNGRSQLTADEQSELDGLLARVDLNSRFSRRELGTLCVNMREPLGRRAHISPRICVAKSAHISPIVAPIAARQKS